MVLMFGFLVRLQILIVNFSHVNWIKNIDCFVNIDPKVRNDRLKFYSSSRLYR